MNANVQLSPRPADFLPVRRPATALLPTLVLLVCAAPAYAGGGGAAAPAAPLPPMNDSGGTTAESERRVARTPKRKAATRKRRASSPRRRSKTARRRVTGGPRLSAFSISRKRMFLYGRPATVSFRIDGRTELTNVKLRLVPTGGGKATTIDLGPRARGTLQRVALAGAEQGLLAQGYRVRIGARDSRDRALRPNVGISSAADLTVLHHHFPLLGSYVYGGSGSRFGAPRNGGRSHQGQDLVAAEGTPVVAPRGGTIETVRYQAGRGGYYIVLDGEGEDRDYAFMHLRAGSTLVKVGQRVRTGQQLAQVGNTGGSSGAHLHFEIWAGGGWYTGGKPVDPLPDLKAWDRFS